MFDSDDDSVVLIQEVCDFGMVIVKADFADNKNQELLNSVTGIVPPKIGKISTGKKLSIGWMAKDEYAIILKKNEAVNLADKINVAMKKRHFLCVDMSDSRRCFKLDGKGWRELLSKGTPADLNPNVLGVGGFRRTRIANVGVVIWVAGENEVYVFSMYSVGDFILEWLNTANLKSGKLNYYQ